MCHGVGIPRDLRACLRVTSLSLSPSPSVKVYHCINGNGLFGRQNGYRTHSNHHHTHNVNYMYMETETVHVNRPSSFTVKIAWHQSLMIKTFSRVLKKCVILCSGICTQTYFREFQKSE